MQNTLTLDGSISLTRIRVPAALLLALFAGAVLIAIGVNFASLSHDAPLLTDSTVGELAVWLVDQSENEAPPSLLGALTRTWAGSQPADLTALLTVMQRGVLIGCVVTALLLAAGCLALLRRSRWANGLLLAALFGFNLPLFIVPTVENDQTLAWVMLAIVLTLIVLIVGVRPFSRMIGFALMISLVLVAWEISKSLAASINYTVVSPQPSWTYTTYPTLQDALQALESGEISAVFEDQNELSPLITGYPEAQTDDGSSYTTLRYLSRIPSSDQVLIFPVNPPIPGRLSIALRENDAARFTQPSTLIGTTVGVVENSFALERYLSLPRESVLVDLKILNDLNLPHLQAIAEAFLQPARRNGDFLLVRILGEAGLYTWREAVFGFVFGVVFGLMLGTAFAHSRLMERALLPYVVASQTVPILAIAPMVVIWLGASFTSVAVIAAYITFFPVTINTLRGLHSPHPMSIELMRSYAANWWTILWKLRFPAAQPYIFTALKVSATASVVGAIIGELPSGMGDGLGRAILNFSSDYSLVSTPKLWAAIITAAFVGITFFVVVSLIERVVLRRYVRNSV
jgi:NitT/TauT family transport system permease protein